MPTKKADEHIYEESGPAPAKIDPLPLKLEEIELESSGYPNPMDKSPTSLTMEAASEEDPLENAPEEACKESAAL